jgi:MSHA biogenesis protein MshP
MTRPSISDPRAVRRLTRGAGVGLVTAIFLLVVMAGLAVALVSITASQQAGSALDVQSARAYQAARAGIEWGLYKNLRTANRECNPVTSFALPAGSTLSGFVVTVTCTGTPAPATAPPDSAAGLARYVITATACNLQPPGGSCPNPSNSPDYVERQIMVTL